MEVRLLGPVGSLADGVQTLLGGGKECSVLALLALEAPSAVSVDRLIDVLWGDEPPRTATKTLATYVSRLRRALEPSASIERAGDAYALRIADAQLDVHRVEQMVIAARAAIDAADGPAGVQLLRAAAAAWRGRSLGDVADEPFAISEAARLDELRLVITEERIEAELALGRPADLVGELEALCRAFPLRERLFGLRMLALYRSGRQAEALRVYQELRNHLADELGIDPSPSLRALEQAVLQQRADLDTPAPRSQPAPGPPRAVVRDEHDLPTGTITFLLTDVQGSTRQWEQFPEAMAKALVRHDAVVLAACGRHDGVVVKTKGEGDSAFLVFTDPHDAVACAIDLQRDLAAENWPDSVDVRVRMAIHTGPVELREGDYYGTVVNRTARLRAAGHGGQILLSRVTADLVGDHLPAGATLRDLGARRLKDLTRPEHVFQIEHPDLVGEFPPLATLDARRQNLPVEPNTIVGRETELADLRALLRTPATRLVTLVGPGGVGKTRLALQAAAEVVDSFDNGVCYVPLAGVRNAAMVSDAIAAALEITPEAHISALDAVIAAVRDERILLVLDNFEQVVDAAADVADLLASCSQLTVVVTSREPLLLRAERRFPVDTLDLDAAVALFLERVAAVEQSFVADTDTVRSICTRLDRLPLALELAAARAANYPARELLARLDRRLDELAGGFRDLPERQRALRATIAWSYELLLDDERALLRALAVFAGGARVDAVNDVWGAGSPPIETLVSKSLIRWDESNDERRVVMLETIREFADDALRAAGEQAARAEPHAAHYLRLAQRAAPELVGHDQAAWFGRLAEDLDNLRAALDSDSVSPDTKLALTADLYRFWIVRGLWEEGRQRLQSAVDLQPGRPEMRARVLVGAGYLAEMAADHATAQARYTQSLELRRTAGDLAGVAESLHRLGSLAASSGERDAAVAFLQESLEVRQRLGDTRSAARVLVDLGANAHRSDDTKTAADHYEQAIPVLREMGDQRELATALANLALIRQAGNDLAQAAEFLREALTIRRALGDPSGEAQVLVYLGIVDRAGGQVGRARRHFEDVLDLGREIGELRWSAMALTNLSSLAHSEENTTEAYAFRLQSLECWQALGNEPQVRVDLAVLSVLAFNNGDDAAARRHRRELLGRDLAAAELLFGLLSEADEDDEGIADCFAALARHANSAERRARLLGAAAARSDLALPDDVVANTAAELGTDRFTELLAAGKAMPRDEAVAYATAS